MFCHSVPYYMNDYVEPILCFIIDINNNGIFTYVPLDNFLILTDVRKTSGFKMANQHSSLDWDHCSLVVSELAKIHATSWAYQNKLGASRLSDHFHCLKQMPSGHLERQNYLNSHFESALETLEIRFGKDSPIVLGTRAFKKKSGEVLGWFLHDEIEFNGLRETDLDKFMRVLPPTDSKDYGMNLLHIYKSYRLSDECF